MRRLKVRIPETLRNAFPNNDTLRFGIEYRRAISSRDGYTGTYTGKIEIDLVPRKGSGFFETITTLEKNFEDPANFASEARRLASKPDELASILLQSFAKLKEV
jgi:hypothetical protein